MGLLDEGIVVHELWGKCLGFMPQNDSLFSRKDRVKSCSPYAHRDLAVKMIFHSVESVLKAAA